MDAREKSIVGVNKYVSADESAIELLKIDPEVQSRQLARLDGIKKGRDNRRVKQALGDLRTACKADKNVMPYVIEAVKAYTTKQEICDVYREVFGVYHDPGYC